MSKDVLNQSELSEFLGISRKTIKKLVEKGELPGRKIGNRYFFDRQAIKGWLTGRGSGGQFKVEDEDLEEEIEELKEKNQHLQKQLEEAEERIEELEEELEEAEEELELFRSAVPCKVCGEPMYPDEKLIRHIREAVRNWGHSSCFEKEKQREKSEEEENSE